MLAALVTNYHNAHMMLFLSVNNLTLPCLEDFNSKKQIWTNFLSSKHFNVLHRSTKRFSKFSFLDFYWSGSQIPVTSGAICKGKSLLFCKTPNRCIPAVFSTDLPFPSVNSDIHSQ